MSDLKKVLSVYPHAWCMQICGGRLWQIWSLADPRSGERLGWSAKSEESAWADSAKRIQYAQAEVKK